MTDHRPADARLLVHAGAIARQQGACHVYLGNVNVSGGGDTYCATCGVTLMRREGFALVERRIDRDGRCPDCGAVCPGVFR